MWATRNVAAPGHFADNAYDAGMFYQWNRKIGWSTTDPLTSSDGSAWDSTASDDDTWEAANDPSPEGWRVPTKAEFATLLDASKVTGVGTIQSGVEGFLFTDIATGKTLFLRAAGWRSSNEGGALKDVGTEGYYWSSTMWGPAHASFLRFNEASASVNAGHARIDGCAVRSVAE
jgi:uncharacterized protein (TIGR02145 family)